MDLTATKLEVFISTPTPPPPPPPDVDCARNIRVGPPRVPVYCIPPPRSRFRKFWSTQINACPSEKADDNCANINTCASPGLVVIPQYDPCFQELGWDGGSLSQCTQAVVGATVSTDNWVAGLIINILGTNAQHSKSACGNRPGYKGGYWLDDVSGAKSGSSIRYIPKTGYKVAEQVEYVKQTAMIDMNKLVTYGVAKSVAVKAKYIGDQSIQLIITAVGVDDETTVVNSSVRKIANAWVWNS